MKIKVEKKIFDSFMKTFLTTGKTSLNASSSNQIPFAYIEADNEIKISGRKRSKTIMARGILEGEVIEPGTFHISDLKTFMNELKGTSGTFYEFDFSEIITVKCGKTFSFPYHIAPAEATQLKVLQEWDKSCSFNGKEIIKKSSGGSATIEPWFSLKDSGQLAIVCDDLFNRTKADDFILSTEDGFKIEKENKTDSRYYLNDKIEATIHSKKKFSLGKDIFPIFSTIKGESDFYVYVTSKGTTTIWVRNNGIEWQILYI